jgi:hypothetical protein
VRPYCPLSRCNSDQKGGGSLGRQTDQLAAPVIGVRCSRDKTPALERFHRLRNGSRCLAECLGEYRLPVRRPPLVESPPDLRFEGTDTS